MAENLEELFVQHIRFTSARQLSKIQKINEEIEKEIKFAIFQVDRLSNLDKLQKVALIFQSEERMRILEILREKPISKRDLKDELEKLNPNPNLDLLLDPFLELTLIRRDWIKGTRDKKTGRMTEKGEYLFLIKDITLARLPCEYMINHLQEKDEAFYELYQKKVRDYFTEYDITDQSAEDLKELASVLLNPDTYDFFVLLRENYYPLKKIPKIFSEFVDSEFIIDRLDYLNVITKIKDKKGEIWICLLTDIEPLITFPEFIIPKIQSLFDSKDPKEGISQPVARKALQLLEATFSEEVEF